MCDAPPDSKLLGVSLHRTEGEEQVTLSLLLGKDWDSLAPTDVTFRNATYVRLDMGLDGKRVCSDDISHGVCRPSSDWLKSLSEVNPFDNFTGYLHFEVMLIPPGGKIDVLATDFMLVCPSERHPLT
jgi:hypothetical protein